MFRHRRQFFGLVEVLPHAIDDAVVELHARHDLRVDRLGPHFFLGRKRFAEGVGPGPCAERRSRGRVDGVKFKFKIYAESARMSRNFSMKPGFLAGWKPFVVKVFSRSSKRAPLLRFLRHQSDLRGAFRSGPNRLEIGKETTHVIVRWTRVTGRRDRTIQTV